MKKRICFALVGMGLLFAAAAQAQKGFLGRKALMEINAELSGYVVDYTHNHGKDNRIYSPALKQKRDMYVYLPPGFDPCRRYPFMFWLHGFAQDEVSFLEYVVPALDKAMAAGKLAPMIVAAPDGTLHGHPSLTRPGSFYLNLPAGNYEDYLMIDMWDFLMANYPILPEREAHAIAGVSMGGDAAFNKAIKYRDRFKTVFAIFPPLNVRWLDCHGRYSGHFDPDCWGWRTNFQRKCEVVARYYCVFVFRQGQIVFPLYGRGQNDKTLELVSRENPIEMLDAYDVRPGQLAMYIAYCGKDEFNITAQVDSFLYVAHQRGLCPVVDFNPQGHHNSKTGQQFLPNIMNWLEAQMSPYLYLHHMH